MNYNIILKGLKPNTDEYETKAYIIEVLPNEDIDVLVTELIYKVRNEEKYYKIKYIAKEMIGECISRTD